MLELLNSFKRYLMESIPKIVIKDKHLADSYETVESRHLGDLYCSISLGMDSLVTYDTIHEESLIQAGITDTELIKQYMDDKYSIPNQYVSAVLVNERKIFLSEFTETNEYYRMLMGLPPIGEDYIFLEYDDMSKYGFDEPYDEDDYENRTPLHLLPSTTLEAMDVDGFLKELQDLYPQYKYISYMGSRKINLTIARRANNFALLYMPKVENSNRFYRDFNMHYEESREYFLSTVYNFSYSSRYENYDGMIGFMILHMAIQRMISTTFKIMLDRDFYDLETCRMFLESYKVPFVKLFTLQQQKIIIKNLNLLLMHKHTPGVLYDVLDLLGYDNIDITKYLLVKQHKTFQVDVESDLRPYFAYKLMIDDDGNQYLELNNSTMYDYYFVGVDMLENDIHPQNITAANTYDYTSFTESDALWIHDEELITKLEEAEINYVETKYANINITFKMHEMMFELVYIARLILDKKIETSRIMIDIPLIVDTPQSLFDVQLLLICLLCKRNHIEPDILKSPSKILYILGFNFEADLEAIKKEIADNPKIYDGKISKYLENIVFITPDDVNRMYVNIRELEDFLANAMQETSSIETYFAYKKLYDTILYTKINNSIYNLKDGTTPDTFLEYFNDHNVLLYDFINNVEEEYISDYIDYIATKFSAMFPDTEYMSYLAPIDLYLIDGILKMLRAFKSYTIDIRDIDVIYRFDSKYHNLLKFLLDADFKVRLYPIEEGLKYSDWLEHVRGTVEYNEIKNKLYELVSISSKVTHNELLNLTDRFYVLCTFRVRDYLKLKYSDTLTDNVGNMSTSDKLRGDDGIRVLYTLLTSNRLYNKDSDLLNALGDTIKPVDNLSLNDNYIRIIRDNDIYNPKQYDNDDDLSTDADVDN